MADRPLATTQRRTTELMRSRSGASASREFDTVDVAIRKHRKIVLVVVEVWAEMLAPSAAMV
jgi:hypothetical protein